MLPIACLYFMPRTDRWEKKRGVLLSTMSLRGHAGSSFIVFQMYFAFPIPLPTHFPHTHRHTLINVLSILICVIRADMMSHDVVMSWRLNWDGNVFSDAAADHFYICVPPVQAAWFSPGVAWDLMRRYIQEFKMNAYRKWHNSDVESLSAALHFARLKSSPCHRPQVSMLDTNAILLPQHVIIHKGKSG